MTFRYSWRPLLALVFFALIGPASAQSDLIITGVVDGPLPNGQPRAIELYAADDVADLSLYGVGVANNGNGSDGVEYVLSGSASAGDYLYVASGTQGFIDFFGFTPTFDTGADPFNGDDAVELFFDPNGLVVGNPPPTASVVDVFGDIAIDGTGEAWEYFDGWAYRMDDTGPDGSTFEVSNWTYSGIDALDGETTNATAATPFPIGTYSVTPMGNSEVVINEVDADTPGADVAEFVEFYNPSASDASLDGLVAVFFNGSNDQAYARL